MGRRIEHRRVFGERRVSVGERVLHTIILAAGSGTRMHSAVPKVLHEVAGTPMLGWVLAAAGHVTTGRLVVVTRFQADRVEEFVRERAPRAVTVRQDDIPGTGRAVECALGALPDGDVLVLCGDVPLLDAQALSDLVSEHRRSGALATVLTALVDDPTGYGRVERDGARSVVGIVEQADASNEQRQIREINSGTYVFDVAALRSALAQVGTANAQGEKYLTDVIGLLARESGGVSAQPVRDARLVQGVNSPEQLALAEQFASGL